MILFWCSVLKHIIKGDFIILYISLFFESYFDFLISVFAIMYYVQAAFEFVALLAQSPSYKDYK